jgi:type II restriction enzyme
MNLQFDTALCIKYKSNAQRARVMTESWVANNVYCLRCGNVSIRKYKNNKPVADYYCENCGNINELKSKTGNFSRKIVDGEYSTMINRIKSDSSPDFLFLSYNKQENKVIDLISVPKHFFVPDIIEKRKPLRANARRAGWTGCNILINKIPQYGKIYLIKNRTLVNKNKVIKKFAMLSFLDNKSLSQKSWIIDVMSCIDKIGKTNFTLEEMYAFESILTISHPANNHIKAKIRQQLQILRDKGIIEFVARGQYRKVLNDEKL